MYDNRLIVDFELAAEFTGFLYGTWKFGMRNGPYMREPFWHSYTEFYHLWRLLSRKYTHILPFPEERGVAYKMRWRNGAMFRRRKALEEFLRSCLQIDGIWNDRDWNQFVNPLQLPVDCYFARDYVKLGLIEWSQNVRVNLVQSDLQKYAVKSIRLDTSFYPQLLNEVSIHQKLDYQHCLKFHGYHILSPLTNGLNWTSLNLVLEVGEQSLLQALEQESYLDGFPETVARYIFYQIMLGVLYLHHHGLCHRDLKPQNILLMKDWSVKICDYGFAYYQGRHQKPRGKDRLIEKTSCWQHFQSRCMLLEASPLPIASCGTLFYSAPEVLNDGGYDGQKADLYSCGKILFRLLVGSRPLSEETIASLTNDHSLSLNLISRLVEDDPEKRADLREVFDHSWLKPIAKEIDLLQVFQTKLKGGDFKPETCDVIYEMGKYEKMGHVERRIYLASRHP